MCCILMSNPAHVQCLALEVTGGWDNVEMRLLWHVIARVPGESHSGFRAHLQFGAAALAHLQQNQSLCFSCQPSRLVNAA